MLGLELNHISKSAAWMFFTESIFQIMDELIKKL